MSSSTKASDAKKAVTLLDVATRAGVDRSVVSRVLSDDPRLSIRDETRARVLAAVRELDYRPNALARSLRTRRADTYGLLIPDFGNPVYASIIQGAEAAAIARDCVLMTGSVGAGPAQAAHHLDVIGRGRVDGLLLAGDHTAGASLEELDRRGIPWLLVNRRLPRARRWVVLDDEEAAGLAVRHLIGLGHERIAHVAGPRDADTARRRMRGWRTAMRAAGLSTPASAAVVSDYTPEGGAAATRELLTRRDRPTAILVANIAAAIGTLAVCGELGVSVPGELSVVAVHDLALAAFLRPALTTVRTPLEKLGERAIELLASTAPDAPIEEVVTGSLELVDRGSTAPPRGAAA
ncbi:LacI family DNA-binding transcriptional regulator [Conexibacter sp. JD483]|uniref:LacI family DNA-binding transcriptional regulator n=1 Tax=unclassified Conexibacter TaxID=2627773 RepID=UPI002728684F|nr:MULTISPECIES: LacI family DNA-binding transcriptional regulator [unclassified Conexibacter]MDO8188186.1 LacI family DNA-binding transcriptional regulator [Conexibacter sp. CPCC 205706]MDO8201593.1 LacI family DNA-binding transcriptional regulator [Conexibacter sp. CPCC 205762]MDR9372375.1 LacI family DNA-binding transcriptional regulator [Conexibacter sp. JD483]